MKLILNTQNVLFGMLILYFLYDIYNKYLQNNTKNRKNNKQNNNLNTKNILDNLLELFFSNKINNINKNDNYNTSKKIKNKNNELLINDIIDEKDIKKKNKKNKKNKKKNKKNVKNNYMIDDDLDDTSISNNDDDSMSNISDNNSIDDNISDIDENSVNDDNISDTDENIINDTINDTNNDETNNISVNNNDKNILEPTMLHNENINIITNDLDGKILENSYIYFDINIGNELLGKVIIKLYDHIVPTTCNNFRKLAISSPIKDDNQPAYTGCIFHKVVKDFMIQSGDFENNDGTGGVSIYGEYFDDEITELTHNKPGLLTMANSGKDTNSSQFIILTKPSSHLDGKHTIFGEVIYGMDIIYTIENVPVDNEYTPLEQVYIAKSGLLLPTF